MTTYRPTPTSERPSAPPQDYEHNSFDIDFKSAAPLAPRVTLSGEVAGLKPPAVSDAPKEPRLFVVARSAEATEVLSRCAWSGQGVGPELGKRGGGGVVWCGVVRWCDDVTV